MARSWLRHCATSRKVLGSIPDGVIDIILPVVQGDSFGTRPKKMRNLKDYSLDFEHAYMTTYLAS